jgi:hypothetical protein
MFSLLQYINIFNTATRQQVYILKNSYNTTTRQQDNSCHVNMSSIFVREDVFLFLHPPKPPSGNLEEKL